MRAFIPQRPTKVTKSTPVKPKTLVDFTALEMQELAMNTEKVYRKWQSDRSARELDWQRVDSIFSMNITGKPLSTADEALIPVDYTENNAVVRQDYKKGTDAKSEELTKQIANTQASACKAGVDTVVTAIMSYLFPQGQENLYFDTYDGQNSLPILALQKVLRRYNHLVNLREAMKHVIADAAKYGTGVLCNEWVYKEKVNWFKTPQDALETGTYTHQRVDKLVYNATKPYNVPINQIYFDPNAKNPNDGLVIRKKRMTGLEMSECTAYKDRKLFEELQPSPPQDIFNETFKVSAMSNMSLYAMFSSAPCQYQQFEVFECWGTFRVGNMLYKNYVLEYTKSPSKNKDGDKKDQKSEDKNELGSHQVLRFEPNTLSQNSPYHFMQPWSDGGTPLPKSPVEYALNHYEAMAKMQVAAKDMIVSAAATPTLVDLSLLEAESINVLKQGVITNETMLFYNSSTGREAKSVYTKMQDNSTAQVSPVMGFLDMLNKQAQDLLGSNDAMMGGNAPQYTKSAAIQVFQEGSKNRIAELVHSIESQLFIPVIKQNIEYFDQNFAQSGGIVVTNTGSFELPPGINFDMMNTRIIIRGSTYSSTTQLQASNMMQTLQMLMGSPLGASLGPGILFRLVKQLLFKMEVPDVDDIIPEELIIQQLAPPTSFKDRLLNMFPAFPTKQAPQQSSAPPGNSGGAEGVPLTDTNANGIIS
jgi:hypothetical protein